jgi:hypothetical protein
MDSILMDKKQKERLSLTLAHTCGTMPITLIVSDDEEKAMFEKAKKKRKWTKLVDVQLEGYLS